MPTNNIITGQWPTAVVAIMLTALCLPQIVSAQAYERAGIGHADLAKRPLGEQLHILAGLVTLATHAECKPGTINANSTKVDGKGWWVINCGGDDNFLVIVPAIQDQGGGVIPCVMAKRMNIHCDQVK
jgi:hypothetical protein